MEIKRKGLLISLEKLEGDQATKLQGYIQSFIDSEAADITVNVWDLGRQGFTIDMYCESDRVVKRLEEYLNVHGFALRLTPKRVQVD